MSAHSILLGFIGTTFKLLSITCLFYFLAVAPYPGFYAVYDQLSVTESRQALNRHFQRILT